MKGLALLVGLNTLILLAHLLEEIRTGFFKKFPFGRIPAPLAVAANVFIYSFALVTIWLAVHGNALAVTLGWVFAAVMLSNAVMHLAVMLVRERYFPGGITACLLLPASVWLLVYLDSL